MAGNAVLLKHAPGVQGLAGDIEALVAQVLPPGLLVNLRVDEARVGGLIEDPRVAAVTLTGSTRAGAAVAARAGAALKKSVLELGGSDPFVVLEDADLDAAARAGAASRLLNAGQSCIAAKRFIVVASVAEAFLARLLEHFRAATIAPMAREDLRAALHAQVLDAVAAGGRCVLGGTLPDGPGWHYPPTVLVDIGPGMRAWEEELFGPVAAVRVVADAEAAIEAANDSTYGLGASVWTADPQAARGWVQRLDAGCVFINGMVKSDPRLPFGGVKRSGWGRELGRLGILEFVNARTVWIA